MKWFLRIAGGSLVLTALLLILGSTFVAAQQSAAKSNRPSEPISMPADRIADSYRIYSSLMPLGETAGKDWPHELWLVRDTTVTVVPSDLPCQPDSKSVDASSMNPHVAVYPSDNRRKDFDEILQDFDKHCHDRIVLDPNALEAPGSGSFA
jgi:hypothetical protein